MSLPLTDFASVEHEVQQPLRAAQILVTVMRNRPNIDPTSLGVLEFLDRSLAASRGMLTELGGSNAGEGGWVQPELTVIDASQTLRDVFNECSPLAWETGLKFRIFAPAGLWTRSDPLMLRRIIENLVTNAVKFTKSGGVLMGVRRRRGELLLEVCDTGPGIGAEHQERVFDEFFQVDTARDRHNGSGLGLANVQQMAASLGHRIELSSVLGRGSVFSVVVPDTAVMTQEVA